MLIDFERERITDGYETINLAHQFRASQVFPTDDVNHLNVKCDRICPVVHGCNNSLIALIPEASSAGVSQNYSAV